MLGSVVRQAERCSSFVTTPIFYVNSVPHLGHVYSSVLADALHRFHKMRTNPEAPLILSTGTDEHGLKVEKSAAASRMECQTHCDLVAKSFQRMCSEYDVSYTHFVRTTDERHKEVVAYFWKLLVERGHIYKAKYEGWYSMGDEAFIPETQIVEKVDDTGKRIMISTESGHALEWTSEENYMFDLDKFASKISSWIRNENPIQPAQFAPAVLKWIEDCNRVSVSRPISRSSWGIPVPGDPSQTIYVWLDALVNYLTVGGYGTNKFIWPPTTQIIGKDILKFHALYWPAFLLAAGLDLPRKLLCHSHWTVNSVKMSKSLGNVVDPFYLKSKYGEGVRYFLLREGVPHSDGNFNEDKLFRLVNAELADTFGNLLSRSCSKALNPHQVWPGYSENNFSKLLSQNGHALKKHLDFLPDTVAAYYEECNFYKGIDRIMETLRLANLFVQEEKPWDIAKISPKEPSLLALISLVMETLRVTGILLSPVIPTMSQVLLDRLNISEEKRLWRNIHPYAWEAPEMDKSLGQNNKVLFRRISDAKL